MGNFNIITAVKQIQKGLNLKFHLVNMFFICRNIQQNTP